MTVINKLACSLNRRDEVPNQELAKKLAAKNDKEGVKELIENLSNKSKDVQNDCIKVLYEIGGSRPSLIAPYTNNFIALLTSKNNRMQWGAMAALDTVTLEDPKLIYSMLAKIVAAADSGSVITRDNCVNILIKLCSVKQYADAAFSLLTEQILNSPVNQVAMYAERALPIINEKNKTKFISILTSRLGDMEKETLKKRLQKVISKFSSKK